MDSTIRIAIFASGSGSNAQKIIEYFQGDTQTQIPLIVTENKKAGVIQRASHFGIPVAHIGKPLYRQGDYLVSLLKGHSIDLVVLAGYLKKVPETLVKHYPKRILNIHPALLPAFGGKGMYGMNVHNAVISSGCTNSGMTIHYVNEVYDEGEIVFQAKIPIESHWTAIDLQKAIQKLEHANYPLIIEKVCQRIRIDKK